MPARYHAEPMRHACAIALLLLGTACAAPDAPASVERWVPEIVGRLPHDTDAWTQGLLVDGDGIYESTGRYGTSALRELDRSTGELRREVALDVGLYGEGLVLVSDRLLQLTWQEETLLAWDRATLTEVDRIGYEGEGWGLCLDGDRLVMADGSATLTLRDPTSFAEIDRVIVRRDGEPQAGLNELECVDGLIYANVWPTTEIAVIDLEHGVVVAAIDGSALVAEVAGTGADALNGIAYDEDSATFLLTGKLWPTIFEVRFSQP